MKLQIKDKYPVEKLDHQLLQKCKKYE